MSLADADDRVKDELTLLDRNDTTFVTLLPDIDVEDIGIGCAG